MNSASSALLLHTNPPTARLVAVGELDLATAPALTAQLNEALGSDCYDFSIDLAEVTFFDAATAGVLVALHRRLDAQGGTLTIVDPTQCVRRVLEIVGLDQELTITTTVRDEPDPLRAV